MNKRLTKKEKAQQRAEAIEYLKEILKPGDRVYTKVEAVSQSGMSRRISCYVAKLDNDRSPYIRNISYLVARATDHRRNNNDGGVVVSGCGMDMGYHLVDILDHVLFGDRKNGRKTLNQSWI